MKKSGFFTSVICSPGLNSCELERAGADRRGIGRMGLDVLAVAEDMLRNDRAQRARHRQQQRRMRVGQMDDRGMFVRRLDRGDRLEHRLERVVCLDRLDRELHVLRRDGLAVMEFGALDQIEGHRQPVIGHLPAFGQIGMRLPVGVVSQRRGEDLRAGHGRGDAGLNRRIEMAGHLRGHHDHGSAGMALLRRATRPCFQRVPRRPTIAQKACA